VGAVWEARSFPESMTFLFLVEPRVTLLAGWLAEIGFLVV